VQIAANVFSSDQENDSDVLAVSAASAALYVSDIPFDTPSVACVSVASTGNWSSTRPTNSKS
jgi:polyribonucleotide nucleotidyltransferase